MRAAPLVFCGVPFARGAARGLFGPAATFGLMAHFPGWPSLQPAIYSPARTDTPARRFSGFPCQFLFMARLNSISLACRQCHAPAMLNNTHMHIDTRGIFRLSLRQRYFCQSRVHTYLGEIEICLSKYSS